jgi:zinc and cadmium transporter
LHEIPQELGDFSLYLAAGYKRRHILLMNCLSGLPIFAGGVMGWWLLKADDPVVVYVLMVTAASFIYISVSDLFPFLHKQHRVENFAKQTMLLLFGLAWVPVFGLFMH